MTNPTQADREKAGWIVAKVRGSWRLTEAETEIAGILASVRAEAAAEIERLQREVDSFRSNHTDAWAALSRLREHVEQYAPGSVMESAEHTGPEFGHEAEQIAIGVTAIVEEAARIRRQRDESDSVIAYALGQGEDLLERPAEYSRYKSNAIERRRHALSNLDKPTEPSDG